MISERGEQELCCQVMTDDGHTTIMSATYFVKNPGGKHILGEKFIVCGKCGKLRRVVDV